MSKIVYAIDPGKTGAIATFRNGVLANVADPIAAGLGAQLSDILVGDCKVVIEQVGGVPGQSGPASFVFGQGYGELLGVCMARGIEPYLIQPSEWKGFMGLRRRTSESSASWKRRSLSVALNLWPQAPWFKLAKHDGRAEAALLGSYALLQGIV
jgi:hypothetical protein